MDEALFFCNRGNRLFYFGKKFGGLIKITYLCKET